MGGPTRSTRLQPKEAARYDEEVKLVRTNIHERGCEQLFYSIWVDTRGSKGERKLKDYSEKNFREREKQNGVEDLASNQYYRKRSVGQRK